MFQVGIQILRKRSIGIIPPKDIHLPVGKTAPFDCEIVNKPSGIPDGPVIVKMKSQREGCLPQTLRDALVNDKIHMNVTNTGQGE